MRPVTVEFQAFGPYAGLEKVDFEALSRKGPFLICGKTGTGKTMILDAMTFALFGKSSGHGRDDFESMRCTNADFNTDTFVRFVFENRGKYYLFERRLERKRKNLSDSYNVSQKDDNGVWQPLMENPKKEALNKKAEEIIGLNYDQFRQVIVLPQGQFEKFLTSNSDEKEKILTSIFGEEKWQSIAKRFYEKTEQRRNGLRAVKDRIENSLKEEGCDSMAQLEDLVKQLRDQKEEQDEEYKKSDCDRILREQQEALRLADRFGDLHNAEKKLAGLDAKLKERIGWGNRANDAERAGKVRDLISAEHDKAKALAKRQEEEAQVKNDADTKKEILGTASEILVRHTEKEKAMKESQALKNQYETKRKDYEGLENAEEELKRLIKAASDALAAEQKEKKESDAIGEDIVRLRIEHSRLQAEHGDLLDRYLAGITGEIAAKLEEGMPCPVCGSTVHPHKAMIAENSVTKAEVDARKAAAERKYQELQNRTDDQKKATKLVEDKHAAVEAANLAVNELSAKLEGRKENLVPGIVTLKDLESEINRLQKSITKYESDKKDLERKEKTANEAYNNAKGKIEPAEKETKAAKKAHEEAVEDLRIGLEENGFGSEEEAEKLMMPAGDLRELARRITEYDAAVVAAKESIKALKDELEGIQEPDREECQKVFDEANHVKEAYNRKDAALLAEIKRLQKKADGLKAEGAGIEEKIREAEEDYTFAKKLRGDTGTGLQRYVLGIMFSSVISAANKMLEMVHGGRYRLYRSDEKAQGTNKRGLELKVFDKYSEEHDGRFVSTLSGGEKFLVSLALSIGMSTIAQKSGIKIEALFIDEGFGSLDEDSIQDAMNILNSIQEANGLVGIISHVQILRDHLSSKLLVEEGATGSHIVPSIG